MVKASAVRQAFERLQQEPPPRDGLDDLEVYFKCREDGPWLA